jgi:hypothetical protein
MIDIRTLVKNGYRKTLTPAHLQRRKYPGWARTHNDHVEISPAH